MTSFFDRLSYSDVAKTIDHSLLKPELDDRSVESGCRLAATYEVASVCVRPRDVERARGPRRGPRYRPRQQPRRQYGRRTQYAKRASAHGPHRTACRLAGQADAPRRRTAHP